MNTELSPTQARVIEAAARGLTNKGIAAELHVSPNTVDSHWRKIFQRLGTHSRTQAVLHVELSRASRIHVTRERVTIARQRRHGKVKL